MDAAAPSDDEMRALLSFRRISLLNVIRMPTEAQWIEIIAHSSLAHLSMLLFLNNPPPLHFGVLFAPLTQLTRLELAVSMPDEETLASLALLPQVRSLKYVNKWAADNVKEQQRMINIEQLGNLTELDLSYPSLYGSHFFRFCRSPLGASLQRLTLDVFSFGSTDVFSRPVEQIPTNELIQGLPLLTSLQYICCRSFTTKMDLFVPHMHLIPNLRLC